jgi:DNA-binding MarR family transcriptional regulator
MGEALMSLQLLRRNDQQSRFGLWRQGLRGRLPATIQPVRDLVPANGWIPDFLTPYHEAMTSVSYLEAIRATSGRLITTDLNRIAATHRLPGWVSGLTHQDPDALQAVTRALAAHHDVAIAPHADRMQCAQDTERARTAATWIRHGVEAVLSRLHPQASWQTPVLILPSPINGDVHLAGRGLILAPMVFCGPQLRLWLGSHDGPALLAYPITFDQSTPKPLAALPHSRPEHEAIALAKLLGATRAKVLTTIAATPGVSTAELASRARVSLASASEHATALRQAGLTTSHRDRHRVLHHPTPTATALLSACRLSKRDA